MYLIPCYRICSSYAHQVWAQTFYFKENLIYQDLAPLCRVWILRSLVISRSIHSGKHSSSLLRLSLHVISTIYAARILWCHNVAEATEMSLHELEHMYTGLELIYGDAENITSMHEWIAFFFVKVDRARVAHNLPRFCTKTIKWVESSYGDNCDGIAGHLDVLWRVQTAAGLELHIWIRNIDHRTGQVLALMTSFRK